MLIPATRLLAVLDPEVPVDSLDVRQTAAGQALCIWIATLSMAATPRDSKEALALAFVIYVVTGLCSAWRVKVPLKRLPKPRSLCIFGLASQALWIVYRDNVMDNLNGLAS
jgi:hypothetical protein